MKLTQHALIIEYVKESGSIVPARMSGRVYRGVMFGNETIRRCQELAEPVERKRSNVMKYPSLVYAENEGRFVRFRLAPTITLPPPFPPLAPAKAEALSLFS